MERKPGAAEEHIQLMQARIDQQTAAIKALKKSGQDTSESVRRLALLGRALEEMRQQLGQLSPTDLDRKRAKPGAAPAHKK
jgi:hypothetical protein